MLHVQPSRGEFNTYARSANAIPVCCSLLSDQLTPVSAFERLAGDSEHAFLLESVVGGEKIARYSFLGAGPIATVEAKDDRTTVTTADGKTTTTGGDPLESLEKLLSKYRAHHPNGLPRFLGGAVGYAAYDIARHYEKLDNAPPDDRHLPELAFGIYDEMV